MRGQIVLMPVGARQERLSALAAALRAVVDRAGTLPLNDALDAVAGDLRIARSEVKHGLNHALGHEQMTLNSNDQLTVAPRT